jgi:hypothetical protein
VPVVTDGVLTPEMIRATLTWQGLNEGETAVALHYYAYPGANSSIMVNEAFGEMIIRPEDLIGQFEEMRLVGSFYLAMYVRCVRGHCRVRHPQAAD